MPRAKNPALEPEDEAPKAAVRRRGRGRPAASKRAAATDEADEPDEAEEAEPAPKATRRRGRGRPAAAAAADTATDTEAEEAPRKRGRKANGAATPPEEWRTVEMFDTDTVTIGEKTPRGKHQIAVVDFIESRGRKKTTVGMVYDALEEEEVAKAYADYIIKNAIQRGVIELG